MTFKHVVSLSDSQLEEMKIVYDVAHNIAKVERHKVDKGERMERRELCAKSWFIEKERLEHFQREWKKFQRCTGI